MGKQRKVTYRDNAANVLYELWLNGISDNEVVSDLALSMKPDLIEDGEEVEDVELDLDGEDVIITLTVEQYLEDDE